MSVQMLLDQMPAIMLNFPRISLVYLFGSQVTGNTGPMSDYDLVIVDETRQDDLATQAEFQFILSKLLHTDRVDVVLLNIAPIELAYHVIASGKLLYQKNLASRVEFEANTLSKYFDYLPVLRALKQQILEGDAHGKRVQRY